MRIITGRLKGRKIPTLRGEEIRPTSDRTKEGMFGVITARRDFDGLHILDLFAGTGNLGFEAISRGAATVTSVEENADAGRLINQTAEKFGIADQVHVAPFPVEHYLQGTPRPFDIIFADPPYDLPDMPGLVDLIVNEGWLKEDGWLILEHDSRHDFTTHPHCVFSKPYGRTIVTIFLSYPIPDEAINSEEHIT